MQALNEVLEKVAEAELQATREPKPEDKPVQP